MQARIDYLDENHDPLAGPGLGCRYVRVTSAGNVIVVRVGPTVTFPLRTRGVRDDQAPLVINDAEFWFGARDGRQVPILTDSGDHAGMMRWRGITSTPEVDVSLGRDRDLDPSQELIRPGSLEALVAGACDFSGQAQRARPLWAWFLANLGP